MNLTIKYYSAGAFVLIAAILVFVFIVTYRNSSTAIINFDKVEHSREIIRILGELNLTIAETETSQRRYGTTGNEEYLKQYESGVAELTRYSGTLHELSKDQDSQQIRFTELQPLIVQILAQFDEVFKKTKDGHRTPALQMFEEGKTSDIRIEIARVSSDLGNEQRKLL